MITLHSLKRSPWIKEKSRRIGRWNATWSWNYCGKWCKWQKSRSWFSLYAWFEWWQTPLIQQMKKKRWFKKYFKLLNHVSTLSLSQINQSTYLTNGSTYTYNDFVTFGLCKVWHELKILSWWDLEKVIIFSWPNISFSESAKNKIIAAGSSIASA